MGRYVGGILKAVVKAPAGATNVSEATGVWSIKEAVQFRGSNNWPDGVLNPDFRVNTTHAWIGKGFNNSRNRQIDVKSFDSNADATDWGDTTYSASARGNGTISDGTIGYIYGGFYCCGASDKRDINKITFATQGNLVDIGDLAGGAVHCTGHMSATKGFVSGGRYSSYYNSVHSRTITDTGSWTDYGDLSDVIYEGCAMGTRTTMIVCKVSQSSRTNNIDQVDMTSAGNATNWGDMLAETNQASAGGCDTVGIIHMRDNGGGNDAIKLDKLSFASAGNATSFGDRISSQSEGGVCGDDVRVIMYGGNTGGYQDQISTLTYASGGTSTDYGDTDDPHNGDGGISHN